LALFTDDLLRSFRCLKRGGLLTTMAEGIGSQCKWHTNLTVMPRVSGECVENFVSQQSVSKDTSIRGYKFFLENYIHDVQGTLCYVVLYGSQVIMLVIL
jgi:hypothetical protein